MMMEFRFSEEKLKENGYTKDMCFRSINRYLNKEGIYAKKEGVYIADEEIAFLPFATLRGRLPMTDWFLKVIDEWYWFDDENDIDYSDDGYNCLISYKKHGV
jgi:hypothetical protein